MADLFLSKIGDSYRVQLLGRTGEPRKDIAINLNLHRDDLRTDVLVTLKTDDSGSVDLGPLEGIYRVRATAPNGRAHRWVLPADRRLYPATIHARTGDVISVPVVSNRVRRDAFSLLETANGAYVRDHFDAISVQDGFATIRSLPAGDYELYIKDPAQTVQIRITQGEFQFLSAVNHITPCLRCHREWMVGAISARVIG